MRVISAQAPQESKCQRASKYQDKKKCAAIKDELLQIVYFFICLPQYLINCTNLIEKDDHRRPVMSKFKISRNPKSFQPIVSVLVYNYNYGKYLAECFDSILEQTYPNIEIIFSDNASTDDSWNIACKYAKENPDRIHIARNRRNFGADANLQNCHAGNRGNFYCIIGSDDVLAPTYVETLVNVMNNFEKNI